MIKSLSIKNFKNIEQVFLNLDRLNVIIGGNNAGKSSVLQSIQFALSAAQATNREEVIWRFIDKKFRINSYVTLEQLNYTPLKNIFDVVRHIPKSDKRGNFEIIITDFSNNKTYIEIKFRKDSVKQMRVDIIGEDKYSDTYRDDKNLFSVYVPGLSGIPLTEEFKSPSIIKKAAAKGDANTVLRNILLTLRKNSIGWFNFQAQIQSIFPEFNNINISYNPDDDEYININVQFREKLVPLDSMGTGMLQAIQILAYINLYNPKLVLLDEPDSHLHPNNQVALCKVLYEISSWKDIQFIIATHSRHLIYALENYSKLFWINDGTILNQNESLINILIDIGALDKGDFFNSNKVKLVVLTEDDDIAGIKTLLQGNGYPLDEVDIWSYKGCTNTSTAKTLSSYIIEKFPNIKILIHKDKDYDSDLEIENYTKEMSDKSIQVFITEGTDIESHFMKLDHIHFLYPEVSLEDIKEIFINTQEEVKEKSIDKFINTLSNKSLKEERSHKAAENARKARINYESNPSRYIHGKIFSKAFKSKLHAKIKTTLPTYSKQMNLAQPSKFLEVKFLKNLYDTIWNKSN